MRLAIHYNGFMGFADEDIRKVREATDLVALVGERVVLKPRNREFWGNCPFHNEKSPSFKVDPSSQFYHCFGCGESGDAITFVRKIDNLDFADAVRYLAERANIELQESGSKMQSGHKARLFKVMERTAAFYHQQLMRVRSEGSDAARAYLRGRGIGESAAREWQLGYAPGHQALVTALTREGFTYAELLDANVASKSASGALRDRFFERIIFPICDPQGRAIALGGRIIGKGEPKYLNSSETALFSKGTTLYALDKSKARITSSGMAVVCEGYTDVMAMHAAGFGEAVATLGTALTHEHVKRLSRFARKLVYLFDGDEAGQRAADRAASLITRDITPEGGNHIVELSVAVLPAGLDPADFLAAKGADAMRTAIGNAAPLLRFAIDRRLQAYDLKAPEQRQLALNEALKVLLPLRGSILATDYLNYISDALAVSYEVTESTFGRMKQPRTAQRQQSAQAEAASGGTGGAGQARGRGAGSAAGSYAGAAYPPSSAVQGAEAAQGASGTARPPRNDQAAKLEANLLAAYVHHPELRPTLNTAFARIEWSSELHKGVSGLLTAAGEGADAAQLAASVIDSFPEGASILASLTDDSQMADPAKMRRHVLILMYSLREEQLTGAIRRMKAEHRRLGAAPSARADELVAEITAKQEELADVRKRRANLPIA
jgi:DNA primase